MYKLVIEDDEGGKTPVNLIRDEITIGRKEGNTIRLTERNVSRRHARIVREDDRVYIEDVAARYGIKKNGKRIDKRAELKEGDVVLIGDYRLTLKSDTPKAKAPGKSDPSEATKITSLEELSGGADWSGNVRESTQIMQTLPAKLVVISSNFAGEEFPLHQREMVIGRDNTCHIIIDHRSISGTHAKIIREDNTTYKIIDLGSKNGIKVSGEAYRATHLKRGDVVELGHVKFRFVEAGENYVFTPQASPDAVIPAAPVAAAGGGGNKLVPALVLLGVMGLVAMVLLFMARDSDEAEATPATGSVVVDPSQAGGADADRVDGILASAREQFSDGRLDRAIGRLETLEDLDPTPEQAEAIEDLLRTARNELPFQRNYEFALEDLDDGNYLRALERVGGIPSHSIFHERLVEQGAYEEILNGVVELGRDALDEREIDEATAMAEEVLLVSTEYAPAVQLLQDIQAYQEAQARQAAARAERAQQGGTTQQGGGRPAAPTVTREQARELFMAAGRKVTSGDQRGAIEDCTRALQGGYTDCHRVLGLAHSQLGQTAQACTHYRRYLAAGAGNPAAIENQMDRIGCD